MKRFVLKLKYLIFAVFTLQIFICSFSFANKVDNIDIVVNVNNDGSARITQKWVGSFGSGTENYIPITTDGFTISDFRVSMNDKPFTNVSRWDINASFDEKKYKCGIVKTQEGVELCFGISEMGENEYIFSYDVSSLVKAYNDKDGFNYMFVNPGMSTFPTNVRWAFALADGTKIDSDNAKIWGFGFDGEVGFDGGKSNANSKMALNNDNYCVIMMCFNKGILNPVSKKNHKFEDIKDLALKGNDYEIVLENQNKNNENLELIAFPSGNVFKKWKFVDVNNNTLFEISNAQYKEISVLGTDCYEFTGTIKNCSSQEYKVIILKVIFRDSRNESLNNISEWQTDIFENVKPNETCKFVTRIAKTDKIQKGNETMILVAN